MILPLIILAIVFLLIAIRQVGRVRLPIWMIMLGGALAVLVTGGISLPDALHAINIDVMIFLFCMFIIGTALEESGYLAHIAYNLFKKAKSFDALILILIFGMGIASAFLMNDTLAIIGTPLVLLLAKKHKTSPKLLLLSLAFAITIGSVMSPLGNPQNLLIALDGGMPNPLVSFFIYLFIPTILNLGLLFLLLKFFHHHEFRRKKIIHSPEPIKDKHLSGLCKISLFFLVGLIILKIGLLFLHPSLDFRLTYISVIAALPIILFSKKRILLVKQIDWPTIIFFASMFILMQAVWNTDAIQPRLAHFNNLTIPAILLASILASQLISNVPLVALYLPLLTEAGATAKELTALAAGSTIAGNLFILGAASNIIIIQNAETRGDDAFTFWDFAKIGIPLTILNALIYYVYLYSIP